MNLVGAENYATSNNYILGQRRYRKAPFIKFPKIFNSTFGRKYFAIPTWPNLKHLSVEKLIKTRWHGASKKTVKEMGQGLHFWDVS